MYMYMYNTRKAFRTNIKLTYPIWFNLFLFFLCDFVMRISLNTLSFKQTKKEKVKAEEKKKKNTLVLHRPSSFCLWCWHKRRQKKNKRKEKYTAEEWYTQNIPSSATWKQNISWEQIRAPGDVFKSFVVCTVYIIKKKKKIHKYFRNSINLSFLLTTHRKTHT